MIDVRKLKEYLGNEIVRSLFCWCVEELWEDEARVVGWSPSCQIWEGHSDVVEWVVCGKRMELQNFEMVGN